jgi:microcystin-dependent protein
MSDARHNASVRVQSYPAPNAIPAGTICRILFIPDDIRVIAAVNDVLAFLTGAYVFDADSEAHEIQMRAEMSKMMFLYFETELGDDVIGAILPMFADVLPPSMVWCEGQTLNRTDYPDLFSRVPSAFRLDADTFQLPDMRGRFAFGADASYEIGFTGGEAEHTLTEAEMPAHTHSLWEANPLLPSTGAYQNPPNIAIEVSSTTGSTGGDQPHNNMPPFMSLRWAIVAKRNCL